MVLSQPLPVCRNLYRNLRRLIVYVGLIVRVSLVAVDLQSAEICCQQALHRERTFFAPLLFSHNPAAYDTNKQQ